MPWYYRCTNCNDDKQRDPWDDDPYRECAGCGEDCCVLCIDEHQNDCRRYQDAFSEPEGDDDDN